MAYPKFTSRIKFCQQFGLYANTTTILFKDFDKSLFICPQHKNPIFAKQTESLFDFLPFSPKLL